MKVFLGVFFVLSSFLFSNVFAASEYRDEALIEQFESSLEQRVGDFIESKSLAQKQAIFKKLRKVMITYSVSNVSEKKKKNVMNLLYAFESYLQKNIEATSGGEKSDLTIRIIDDARCLDCLTDIIISDLQNFPFTMGATYIYEDFSDDGVQEYLVQNNIKTLPAITFSTNQIDDEGVITSLMYGLRDGNYTVDIGSRFNPFLERSERGYALMEQGLIDSFFEENYTLGNTGSDIVWIEYSDIECPYCKYFYDLGVKQDILKKYEDEMVYVFQHYPLSYHKNSMKAAEILECSGEQGGATGFFETLESFYSIDSIALLLDEELLELVSDTVSSESLLKECFEDEEHASKIQGQMNTLQQSFDMTGIPYNVIINRETREYIEIPASDSFDVFDSVIQSLLTQ